MNQQIFQTSHPIKDLNQCQINQIESLIQNLPHIQKENLLLFPKDLVIQKNDDQYDFFYKDLGQSFLSDKSKIGLMQEHLNHVHFSKHLLKLLIQLQKYNIYLPTLKQENFINNSQEDYPTQYSFQENPKLPQYNLYYFGLEKLEYNSQDLLQNHCLSPELEEAIKCENNHNEIQFNEKMAIFNFGCIIFELKTLQRLYNKQENKYHLTKYIFPKLQINYENFLFGQLVQKCTLEEEQESNKRITFQEAQTQLNYLEQCVQIIARADKYDKKVDLDLFFSLDSSLNEQLNRYLKYKLHHQITGRLFIMQNLTKIKFIYNLFQEQKFCYFRDFLILKLIFLELFQLKELNEIKDPQKIDNKILDFTDSVDEINEFQQYYSKRYTKLLQKIIKGILDKEKQNQNDESKKFFKQQFKHSELQDFQQEFHANLFTDKTPQQLLQKLCLQKIQTIFLYDKLMNNFQPIFLELLRDHHCYEIYDNLLKILFQKDANQYLIQKTIEAIKKNFNN